MQHFKFVKFVFSKKATKIDKIFTVDLTLTTCQVNSEDFINFVAFLEKMNFKKRNTRAQNVKFTFIVLNWSLISDF